MKKTNLISMLTIVGIFVATMGIYWGCGASTGPCIEKVPPSPSADEPATSSPKGNEFKILGLVKQPMTVSIKDLMSHQSVTVRLNDVKSDGAFRGVFKLTGVPLRTLLEMAQIQKKESVFSRAMDLAILVRGTSGDPVILSWGEVFYRNPSEFVLAYASTGLLPHKECASCHAPETYEPWRNQILREIPYPKLVVTRDFYSDRSVEAVTSIEVVELGYDIGYQVAKKDAPKELRAETVKITDASSKTMEYGSFDKHLRYQARVIQAGDGTGFHGVRTYDGISLKALLEDLGYGPDPSSAFLFSARDGYRVLLSNGEIFYCSTGKEIMLSDTMNGTPLEDSGKFQLVPVDDQSADRWLKGVATIDMVKHEPKVKQYYGPRK